MSNTNHELVMESTHGRKDKCKTEFKAVINKVIVSGVILATIMTSTVSPVMAAEFKQGNIFRNTNAQTQIEGLNIEDNIYEIKATIKAINEMKKSGDIDSAKITELANLIYSLQRAVQGNSDIDVNTIDAILTDAINAVKGLKDASKVEIAVTVVRTLLGIDSNVIEEKVDSHNVAQKKAAMVSSFSDVPSTHWGYNSIMAMTKLGYFAGKGEIVNGVGVFAPSDTMTRAEFLTVVARIVIGEDNIYRHEGSEWWQDYYTALVDHRVIGITDFDDTKLNEPMTRAEMAFVAVKAMEYMGEDFKGLPIYSIPNYIPDYDDIQPRYQQSVVRAYGKGILVGVDSKGTYDPNGVLERAAATTVLYRIIEKGQRADVDFKSSSSSGPQVNASGLLAIDPDNGKAVPAELVNSDSLASITIYEGQNRSNRPAKAGDVYVKANGEHITITVDQYGIVGGGQGLQLDNGLNYNSVNGSVKAGNGLSFAYGGANLGGAHNGLYWVDSTGKILRNGKYMVNLTTGEAHWDSEWQYLRKQVPAPDYNGKTDGEVSNDVYKLYKWDAIREMWGVNYQ